MWVWLPVDLAYVEILLIGMSKKMSTSISGVFGRDASDGDHRHGSEASVGGRFGSGLGKRRPIPPKLYRIGEVVAYSGVSRQTIHNYTAMGLLRESRWTPGGHRLYDESVFGRLDRIAELKAKNKSLHDIREAFAHMGGGR